ncbi:MAG TPA: DUF6067 family protein, partial [bacterium]|nr:DUF6067 family protein [bacterium]
MAELFLDPGQTKEHYYQFAASPSAARFDLSSRKSTNFNPDWKVKGAICEWGWALEMAIPFTELAHQNEFFGTPAVGDVWGINFCRDQGSLHEWSQWEVSMMSFHEVKNFGTAVFCGRKEGEKLPTITAVEFEPLFYGPGTLSFQVKSTRPYLGCDFFLSQDGQSVVRRTGEKVAPGQLQLPYQISRPGTWRLAVSFYEGKNKVYSGATFCQLPPVAENLLEIRKKMDQARMKLKTFQHAYRPLLEKQLNRLEENLAQAIQQVQQPSSLSRQDWQKLTSVVLAAGSDWKKLDFDLGLVGLYPEKKTASFGLVPVPATAKIYPDSILTRPAGPVKLALAGNEYESFQMVLVPFWKEVPDIQVSFSDLSGPKKISRKNFSSFRVEYVRLKNVDPEDTHLREYEPDILFPAEKFSLQPGKLQPVWIDFYLPPNTPAGTYRGRVTFTTGKESRSWPVEVTSYGFNLPRKSSIENQFWFSLYRWKNFYGTLDYTPELYAKHAAVLSRYRISCLPSDWIIMWDKIRVYYEEDGRFTFDFSELDKFIKIGLEAGSNTYWASLGCNLGSLTPFSRPWTKVIDRKTGKETTLDRVMKDWLDKFREGKTYWDENPMYRDYLQAYVAHLKELGLLETAYWEIYDEPNDNSRWLDMLRHHRWLRQFVPELKLFNFGVEPTQVKAGQNALGLIDCWAPHID